MTKINFPESLKKYLEDPELRIKVIQSNRTVSPHPITSPRFYAIVFDDLVDEELDRLEQELAQFSIDDEFKPSFTQQSAEPKKENGSSHRQRNRNDHRPESIHPVRDVSLRRRMQRPLRQAVAPRAAIHQPRLKRTRHR